MLLKYNSKKTIINLWIILIFFTLLSCSTDKKEEEIIKKKVESPNIFERVRESEGSLLFGKDKGSSGTTYNFATSNILWRATLQSLNFVPLVNASYSGGIVVTDWYGSDSNESIKIQVKFLSDEIKTTSIEVNSFKKICLKNNLSNCKVTKLNSDFNAKIRDSIMTNVRKISIEDAKKK